MKEIFIMLLFIPSISFSQIINEVDQNNNKQGVWKKTFSNGALRYKGQFNDNKPYGLFFYYYNSGELQAEKEFFHNGEAAATHIFYKDGSLKASGIYVRQEKDSTWNYYIETVYW